jgi:hypothetical protein
VSPLWEITVKIVLSSLLGGLIGAERERKGKWAGLRTHMLIAVGSALLTHISILVGREYAVGSNAWDPGRIAAQIVSGVGFIGAGTIIQSRGAVQGLTTAAGLWVASAIGNHRRRALGGLGHRDRGGRGVLRRGGRDHGGPPRDPRGPAPPGAPAAEGCPGRERREQ